MRDLQLKTSPQVRQVFDGYPDVVRPKLLALRQLVLDTARKIEDIKDLEESLKWGEPSYKTNIGSTLRMDWKPKTPNQYALYFQCTSRLVETFRPLFGDTFQFEGNRAIIFALNQEIPEEQLKYCIRAALTYHKIKHLPTLGL